MCCLSRSAEFVIAFNRGIDAAANLLEAGLDTGVLQAKVGGLCKQGCAGVVVLLGCGRR